MGLKVRGPRILLQKSAFGVLEIYWGPVLWKTSDPARAFDGPVGTHPYTNQHHLQATWHPRFSVLRFATRLKAFLASEILVARRSRMLIAMWTKPSWFGPEVRYNKQVWTQAVTFFLMGSVPLDLRKLKRLMEIDSQCIFFLFRSHCEQHFYSQLPAQLLRNGTSSHSHSRSPSCFALCHTRTAYLEGNKNPTSA